MRLHACPGCGYIRTVRRNDPGILCMACRAAVVDESPSVLRAGRWVSIRGGIKVWYPDQRRKVTA